MIKNLLTILLLAIILIFAGYLRFTGQNWDDYTYSHPDERFLTLLLLPALGGGNEYTEDNHNFPEQSILVRADDSDAPVTNSAVRGRIGVHRGSVSAQVARWHSPNEQIFEFDEIWQAINALEQHQVDTVVITSQERPADGNLVVAQTLDTRTLQELRCRHLHPASDGRGGYFDARCSPLNPHQAGHGFYVYGSFPLFLAHFASQILGDAAEAGLPVEAQSGYLVWRALSAIFDMFTVVLVFALGSRMHNRWVGLFAALLYAAAPLAIQKAHYGTTNAIAACMVTLALYFAVAVQQRGKLPAYCLFGVALGAAVASRFNLVFLAGVVVLAALYNMAPALDSRLSGKQRLRIIAFHFFGLVIAGLASFLAFRLLNPYAFIGPGFFDILPNDRWLENLRNGSMEVSGFRDHPPNWQWFSRASYFYPLKDMFFWAMGPAMAGMAWFGFAWAAYRICRMRVMALSNLLIVGWVAGYFIWANQLWPMTMRYYLPLYSSLAVLAGWAIHQLFTDARARDGGTVIPRALLLGISLPFGLVGLYQIANGVADATALTAFGIGLVLPLLALLPIPRTARVIALGVFTAGFTAIWGLMFGNVYRHQTTLVQGSRYLFERVPGDFAMRIEGADETVPLINIGVYGSEITFPGMDEGIFNRTAVYSESEAQSVGFTAPATGTVQSVFAPHLGDPHNDDGLERLEIRVYAEGSELAIAEAVLEANLTRDEHPLGSSYDIPFAAPLQVEAGKTYRFEISVGEGSGYVMGSGSVVLTEGNWDNAVTGMRTCKLPNGLTLADRPPSGLLSERDCKGEYAFSRLINSYDQIMSFPVDNEVKYDSIIETLELGEYLTIASNRFYDTQTRNRMRWPLTELYYEKLFAGELGYELAALFDEPYSLGPWRVSDQHLPIYDSPAWLNEIEADEAFHVYDHPAVFIFRKTEEYSSAKVKALFSSVSLNQVHQLSGEDSAKKPLGVLYWTSKEADAVPTGLTFPSADYRTQTEGGTWSERFFSDSLANRVQILGALFWYLSLFVLGLLAFPIVFALMPKLADGGYGISKLAGLLLVAWFTWAASTLKVPLWSQGGILLAMLLLGLASFVLARRNRVRMLSFMRERWRSLAWMEIIAIACFLLMLVLRLTNPDLWHPSKGGEKPMDFAFLNGVLRSTIFPPIDPWFSGGYINYYYFGFVLVGAPALLLGIVPAFAYNLMIPTVFTLTGAGAFCAAFNILSYWRRSESRRRKPAISRPSRLGNPWVAGILALLMCALLGNLDTIRVFSIAVAQNGGYSKPQGLSHFLVDEYRAEHGNMPDSGAHAEIARRASQSHLLDNLRYEANNSLSWVRGLLRGVGRIITTGNLAMSHDRWYWGPSRILAETPGVGESAITEMPFFTFVYGDLHAHMINMPLILLTIVFVFNELIHAGKDRRDKLERVLALALGGLAVGLMMATNTWDWPSMTLFAVISLSYCWGLRWRHSYRGGIDFRFYGPAIGLLTIALVTATLLQARPLPFISELNLHLTDAVSLIQRALLAGMGLIVLWLAARHALVRSSALDYLGRVGGFLFLNWAVSLPYTTWHASTYTSLRPWLFGKTPLWAYFDIHGLFLFLVVSLLIWESVNWLRHTRLASLRGKGGRIKAVTLALCGTLLLAMAMTLAHYQVALIALPLVAWIAVLFFRPGQSRVMRFLLVLVGLALSLTLGVEIVVVGGDSGRQNTVFKFYIEVWLLMSVFGGVAMSCLLSRSQLWSRRLRALWLGPCVMLFAIASAFPILATRARSLDRMTHNLPLTLDGLAYMKETTYHASSTLKSRSERLNLDVDYQLIRWMQENISGSPVILEGRGYPSEYRWNGRFSITTGLPSPLGWAYHQRQQRSFNLLPRWVNQRELNVRTLYDSPDIDIAVDMLRHFDISYIVRSGYEALQYDKEGLAKFDRMVEDGLLSVAFAIDGGTIYEVNKEALLAYQVERYR